MLKKLRRKVYRKIRFQTWYRKAYYYHRKRRDLDKTIAQYRGVDVLSDKKRLYRLRRDMIRSLFRYGSYYNEYFLFGYEGKDAAYRDGFITEGIRMSYYPRMNDPKNTNMLENKYLTYQKFRDFYGRDVLRIKKGAQPTPAALEALRDFTQAHPDYIVKPVYAAFGKGGMTKLAEVVSDQLGIPVDYTVSVDLTGFEALVEAIGGVNFDVPIDMDYDDPIQNLSIHFKKGVQYLNGADAMRVVRFRHNNDGSGYGSEDIGRMQTQQNFLKAVAQQTLTLSNVDKVGEFAKIFQQYVDTDLSLGNLAWLGKEAISMGVDKISFSTLPNEWRSPYIYLDPDATLELVNQYLNPYVEDRTMEDLDIPS